MFQNQNTNNNEAVGVNAAMPLDGATEQQQQQQNINYNGVQPQQQNKGVRKKPYVKIVEQPASKALRFRYECEGRSAGSIPGANSTPENKTYPTIEIVGYKGRAVVVVSCVTKDPPYRPHPHNLVGKEGCKKGVCTLEINSETMRAVFSNLGIQCVKKKDIEAALKAREDIRVDPFKTGFSHRSQNSSIDLNVVRLCFQVFMESEQKGRFTQPLPPVVSDPIFDKKAMSDLVICRLCTCSATVLGNTQIILLCEKVAKEDIAVRFWEEKNNQVVWEAYGEFQHTDVHKQTAIAFKTPRYHTLDITEPAKVFIQLRRPSDGVTSEALPFEYIPLDSGRQTFWNLRRNLKRKPDLELFQQILNVDSEQEHEQEQEQEPLIASNNHIVTDLDEASVHQEQLAMVTADELISSAEIMQTDDLAVMQSQQQEIDKILDEKVRELEEQKIHDEQMLVEEQQQVENLPEEEKEAQDVLDFPSQMGTTDKIHEWMKYNECQTVTTNGQDMLNDDKTLNELLEQVVELDEIYSDHVHRRNSHQQEYTANSTLNHQQSSLDRGESFDDAATYTSLQIAFKHPIDIPVNQQLLQQQQQQQICNQQIVAHNNQEEIIVTEDKKLPPLPPKRMRKVDAPNNENESLEANQIDTKQQTPIIIMKTPDRVPSPRGSVKVKNSTLESNSSAPNQKPKKSGFFSKIFARRKSRPELNQEDSKSKNNSKLATPLDSREASIHHFPLNDTKRTSTRSVQSLQANSLPNSPTKVTGKTKSSKPVGRSVSSVSGKRPAHLNAEVIHIPLKGESVSSLPQNEGYSHASTITLDRRTVSALQLAEIPINDGNMELVAIADRQSLRNLCEGELNIRLDPNVDLTEAEHFALYTSVPPQATMSEFDENSAYYAAVDAGEILTPNEIAKRLTAANRPK